jgi:DNA-binding NarL/FixJ family response regulator
MNGRAASTDVAAASVVVVDADPLARRATHDAIAAADGLEVVGEADTMTAALRVCGAVAPQVVVVELDVAPDRGEQLITAVCAAPAPPQVVAFSHLTSDALMVKTLRAGAVGFVPTESGTEALVAAIRAMLRHELAISRTHTMQIIELLRDARQRSRGMRPVRSNLTAREWEIFELMADGVTTRQMADRLVLSESTIYSHIKSILRKLGVHSRAEAVAAVEQMSGRDERRRGD